MLKLNDQTTTAHETRVLVHRENVSSEKSATDSDNERNLTKVNKKKKKNNQNKVIQMTKTEKETVSSMSNATSSKSSATPILNLLKIDKNRNSIGNQVISSCSTTSSSQQDESHIPKSGAKVELRAGRKALASKESVTRDKIDSPTPTKYSSTDSDDQQTMTHKKKKKQRRRKSLISEALRQDITSDQWRYEKVIGVYLHHTSKIINFSEFKAPRARISFVDLSTGQLLAKTSPERNVTGESSSGNSKLIQPIISNPANLADNTYLLFVWEQLIMVNDDATHIVAENVQIFFEILNRSDSVAPNADRICWAFLRLKPSAIHTNLNEHCRLQLYRYSEIKKADRLRNGNNSESVEIYNQWLSSKVKYPGEIYVTVKAMEPSKTTHADGIKKTPKNIVNPRSTRIDNIRKEITQDVVTTMKNKWREYPGYTYKIPNNNLWAQKLPGVGGLVAKFNSNGLLFAYTDTLQDHSLLYIASAVDQTICYKLYGHSSLIHNLDWAISTSHELLFPQYLVTASADFTAIIWSLRDMNDYKFQILRHSSFVYTAKFIPIKSNKLFIATGGRDTFLKIFRYDKTSMNTDLCFKLTGHEGYITNIVCKANGEFMYSSDSTGSIIEWASTAKQFTLMRRFSVGQLHHQNISCLSLYLRGDKIFIQNAATNFVYIIGLATGVLYKIIDGNLGGSNNVGNDNLQTQNSIASCGSYLFTNNSDKIRVYNIALKKLESVLEMPEVFRNSKSYISSIDYHPKGSYLLASIYGKRGGIYLMDFVDDNKIVDPEKRTEDPRNDLFDKFFKFLMQLEHKQDAVANKENKRNAVPEESQTSQKSDSYTVEIPSNDGNTFTVNQPEKENFNKVSGTYTIKKSNKILDQKDDMELNLTYEVSKNNDQNDGTYSIKQKGPTDEDTTISESFN